MYKYSAENDEALNRLMLNVVTATADYAKSNWLIKDKARLMAIATAKPLELHIEAQVQLAYQAGRDELMLDNERLRNLIALRGQP